MTWTEARRKAWETRRAKYGNKGHKSSAYRRKNVSDYGTLLAEMRGIIADLKAEIRGHIAAYERGEANGVETIARIYGVVKEKPPSENA